MKKAVFLCTLVLAFIFQFIAWNDYIMLDVTMWTNQASYVDHNDVKQYDAGAAYGHPGGPLIQGSLIMHKVFGTPYTVSNFAIVLASLNALVIACAATLAYILRRNSFWWVLVFFTLSMHRLFFLSTPPSALAALTFALLCLFALYISKNKESIKYRDLAIYALISGFLIATRVDVGILASIFLFPLLIYDIGFRKTFYTFLGTLATFCIFNPFMYFMPMEHLADLVYKFTFHYSDYSHSIMPFYMILDMSIMLFIGILIFLGAYSIKSLRHRAMYIPAPYGWTIFFLTTALYTVVLTSTFQTPRYLLPAILLWEVLLPLFVFELLVFTRLPGKREGEKVFWTKESLWNFVLFLLIIFHLALYANGIFR